MASLESGNFPTILIGLAEEWCLQFFRVLRRDKRGRKYWLKMRRAGCESRELIRCLLLYTEKRAFEAHFKEETREWHSALKSVRRMLHETEHFQVGFKAFRQNRSCEEFMEQVEMDITRSEVPVRGVYDSLLYALHLRLGLFSTRLKFLINRRGIVRRELFLALLVRYVRSKTGKPHHAAIAHLLQVANHALGVEDNTMDAEPLRRVCERYEASHAELIRIIEVTGLESALKSQEDLRKDMRAIRESLLSCIHEMRQKVGLEGARYIDPFASVTRF